MEILIITVVLLLGYLALKKAVKNAGMKCVECEVIMEVGEVKPNWTRLVCPRCGNTRFLMHNH